jgi:hypothetical protein
MWDLLHPGRRGRGSAPNRRYKAAVDVQKKLAEYYSRKSVEDPYKKFFATS